MQRLPSPQEAKDATRVLLVVQGLDAAAGVPDWVQTLREAGDHVYLCATRGVGETRWTRKNPPNYVERSHALLGRTVDTGRVWDVAATARYLRAAYKDKAPVHVLGQGAAALLAAYAALWEPDVAAVTLNNPPPGHMAPEAPQFLNVLRVCDVPEILGMIAPRPLTVYGASDETLKKAARIYAAAGGAEKFVRKPGL